MRSAVLEFHRVCTDIPNASDLLIARLLHRDLAVIHGAHLTANLKHNRGSASLRGDLTKDASPCCQLNRVGGSLERKLATQQGLDSRDLGQSGKRVEMG
jgi:hypothetical protein